MRIGLFLTLCLLSASTTIVNAEEKTLYLKEQETFQTIATPIADDVKMIEGKTLPFSSNAAAYIRGDIEPGASLYSGVLSGMRFLNFQLQAGETLELSMNAEDQKVVMLGRMPEKMDGMTSAIRCANMTLWAVRTKRYKIKNTTKGIYPFFLTLLGTSGYSYKINIKRTI